MKKILILGAGIYQVPLIKKAKQMGLYTIVASYQGAYPGLAYASEVWEVDTRDAETLLTRAREAKIAGVITAGTDVAVRSIGIICETLGLTGLSAKAAETVTDKAMMKAAFTKGRVATPKAYRVESLAEACAAFLAIDGAALVKVVDSSGSRGITKVDEVEAVKAAWETARSISKTDYLLVEEFVDGYEIGVDGFIHQGKIKFMLPHDKFTHTVAGVTIPEGHMFPFSCTASIEAAVRCQIKRAVYATGLDNCAINADVIIKDNQAYILEIGGRAGATCIPELISIYGDFDYYQQMILSALGEVPAFSFVGQTVCMAKLLFSNTAGGITAIDERALDRVRANDTQISLDFSVGEKVEAVRNGTSRIGQVVMKAADVGVLDETMSKVRGAIEIEHESLETLWNK